MDVLDKPNLRRNAIVWLVKDFKKTLVTKKLWRQYSSEIIYWLLTLTFIVLIAAIGYMVQSYILVNIVPGETSKLHLQNYKWILSSLLIATSFISLYRTVKKQTELKYGQNNDS